MKEKLNYRWYDRFGIGVLCLIVGYMIGAVTVMYRIVEFVMLYALLLGVFCGYVAIGDIVATVIKRRIKRGGEKA